MITARTLIFTTFSLLILVADSFAKEMIFYKYADGDTSYSTFIADRTKEPLEHSAKFIIASNLILHSFPLKQIPKSLYDIKKTENILFFGHKLTQYIITPTSNDRFKHIIWVDKSERVFKIEMYDPNDKLMLAFANVDFDELADIKHQRKTRNVNTPFYKGFTHMRTKLLPDNVIHLMFSDRINSFSIFIDPNPIEDMKLMKIIYGNYLLSKVVNGIEYSIVGSVSYEMMDDIIDKVAAAKERLFEDLSKNRLLTDDILK